MQPTQCVEAGRLGSLGAELRTAFLEWAADPRPWPEERFAEWARRVFALQYRYNQPYRRYCRRLDRSPDNVATWRDVPAVPTAAFREIPLCVGPPDRAEVVFRTSGTSRGAHRRGVHPVVDTDLYRASAESAFLAHVLDGPSPLPICSLLPPFEPSRDSSLSWMCETVVERFGAAGSVWAADESGIDWEAADRFAAAAAEADRPVGVLATTLALDAWTGRLARHGTRQRLPEGSRLMDTGGAKGRSGFDRSSAVDRAVDRLGVRRELVINEFGMTELLSQRYSRPAGADGELRGRRASALEREGGPALYGPPWLRTRALDPATLAELPEGEVGLLCHFDLANAGSVSAILTEDLGTVRDDAIEWVGRSPGAAPRGCSLATAELLSAQADA